MPVVSDIVRAAMWMAGALFAFMAMTIAIRELGGHMGVFEILFFRSLVSLLVIGAAIALTGGGWAALRSAQPGMQVFRNVAHFAGQWGWAYGITMLPLATVYALEFTLPLWTMLLAVPFLGERINRGRVASIAIGFAGVLVIVRPGGEVISPAALVVLGAAVVYAASHIAVKRLTRTDGPLTVLFWMGAVQIALGAVPAALDWVAPRWADAPALFTVGASAMFAHYCIVRAFKLADATVVVPMDFLRLPLIAVVGLLAYGEPFDPHVLGGGAIIFAGTILGVRHEARRTAAA